MDRDEYMRQRNIRVNAEYRRRRNLIIAHGGTTTPVPTTESAAHIKRLMELGWSGAAIAQSTAGVVNTTTIHDIIDSRYQRMGRPQRTAIRALPYTLAPNEHVADTALIPILGAQRRAQALQALGWTHGDLKNEWDGYSTHIVRGTYPTIQAGRWRLFDDVYRRLCMTPGPSAATTGRAARAGYSPPLAWNCIDDPDEQPTGLLATQVTRVSQYADAKTRAADLAELDSRGVGISEACRALNISRGALQQWCKRKGLSDVYRRLAMREDYSPNGSMGAA